MPLWKQLSLLALVAALGLGWYLVGPDLFGGGSQETAQEAESEAQPEPVRVSPVRMSDGAGVIEAIGTGRALQSVRLFPESAGRVTEIAFEAGERVEQGETLMQLESEAEELAVELAKARLQAARQELQRYENAAGSGAVSGNEVDTARNAVETARIRLRQAEVALWDRTLVAPFTGVVGIPQVDAGDRVTESTEIATLDDRSAILVDFDVPEAFSATVGVGDTVTARTVALPDARFSGRVAAVASRIDPETRTLRVRARIPNDDGRLRAGMSFTMRLPLDGQARPSVPSIAIQWEREGAFVWKVADGKAERVDVEVRRRTEAWVLVNAPLREGDRIVVEGIQSLDDGTPVRVKPGDGSPQMASEPADGA